MDEQGTTSVSKQQVTVPGTMGPLSNGRCRPYIYIVASSSNAEHLQETNPRLHQPWRTYQLVILISLTASRGSGGSGGRIVDVDSPSLSWHRPIRLPSIQSF